jgi:BASS family bile acid:Na+ symporter
MDSALTTVALPLALAIVMLGLGLSLEPDDFRRVTRQPKAVAVALALQVVVLPLLCFGLVLALDLTPVLAVGMLLLAASPGGTTANLFSHVFRGDVALNVTLTAVNSVLAVITLPVVVNLAIGYFQPGVGGEVGLQLAKTAQVFAIVLVPVVVGMLVRRARPAFALRMDRPVRLLSAVVLALVILGAVLAERENVGDYFAQVGVAAAVFCLASLGLGFGVPRLLGIGTRQAVAAAFEVGVHNATLAITVAISVLDSVELSIAPAVYGIVMFPLAAVFGELLAHAGATATEPSARAASAL